MSEAIAIQPRRTVTDLLNELNFRIEEMRTVGTLLGEATIPALPGGTVSAAGYLIFRLAADADAISSEIEAVCRGAS